MKKILVSIVLLWGMVGCSGKSRNSHADIVNREASYLDPCSQKLSAYSDFKVEKMELSSGIAKKEDKVAVAKDLENKISKRVAVLIEDWKKNPKDGQSGTVLIQTKLHSMHIVGIGARIFIGSMAGNSNISMDLVATDEATGNKVCKANIDMDASASSGGYSFGGTDKNLLNYVADVSAQYLKNNY